MSTIKKVIEVLASSEKSFEDALQRALTEASTTVKGIKSIYIKDQSCRVRDNKIVEYRITAKITFEVMHKWDPNALHTGDAASDTPTPAGDGSPDYSQVQIKTQPDLPRDVEPGGSATAPESGGGYSN
ncbi:dodecin family protein [Hymenobacter cellulosilyticus]|uniref:Dodecin family protein n=1 Tax=Hymenobacter cellulosilyticus TaxID=2932248 RepID=A0A8T9QBN0_9BACT|nr:dodecin family protein [Hymenobacter cellulosilyticus]UOQ73230.1 dodecin family protein [Hymenobacter cellulosilyticus]